MSVMCTYGMYGAVPRLEILQKDCENGFPNLPHTCREKKTVFISPPMSRIVRVEST